MENKSNLKKIIAWGSGIISFIFLSLIISKTLSILGIPTFIEYGETRTISYGRAEYESDGSMTDAGFMLHILAIMYSTRIGLAIYHSDLNGNISAKGNIDFKAWTYGLIAASISSIIFYLIAHAVKSDFLATILNLAGLASIAVIGLACKNWRDKQITLTMKNQK